jgi:exopolyphosphatase/guanosine-5'-triphosphate,3'-diphosphate pyrophosphatase
LNNDLIASPHDRELVTQLLGREPHSAFAVVVRDSNGIPVVIKNAPFLADGTPMPTLYWLCSPEALVAVSRLEAAGGVNDAEAQVDSNELEDAHRRYQAERDAYIPSDHDGPRPSGGVAGTRIGVKCLHAHYAWHLAGGDDPVGRWVAERIKGQHVEKTEGNFSRGNVAAIDIGTNSTNLLIVDHNGKTLERQVNVTRLGQGVDKTRTLLPDAIDRTIECLTKYRELLDAHGAPRLRVVASSASRDATNRDDFFDRAEQVLGVRPELVSGEEEARLAYRGCTSHVDVDKNGHLIIDIGGGSTELIVGTTQLSRAHSIDVGAVRMTERHLQHDPPLPEELLNAIGEVQDLFDDVVRANPSITHVRQIIGTAGTIVTIAAVELGQQVFDADELHGFRLTREAIEDVFRTLATEPLIDRIHNPGLPRDRADVIVGGCCVLVALMRTLDADELIVSTNNILDGVCAELLSNI